MTLLQMESVKASCEHLAPLNTLIVYKHMHPSFRGMQFAVTNRNSPPKGNDFVGKKKMHSLNQRLYSIASCDFKESPPRLVLGCVWQEDGM